MLQRNTPTAMLETTLELAEEAGIRIAEFLRRRRRIRRIRKRRRARGHNKPAERAKTRSDGPRGPESWQSD